MAGLVDLSGLQDLSRYSVAIHEMDEKSKLNPNDVFVVDKVSYENYLTRTVTFSTLSSSILSGFENHPIVNLSGHWNFTKNNLMLVDTFQAIKNSSPQLSSKIAINLDYLENAVLKSIYDLSTELYSPTKPHVPSYVGQIITSSTLSTLASVKEIYGDYTDWTPLNQVFLCGEGKPVPNNYTKFGENVGDYELSGIGKHDDGEKYVTLTIDQIPKHTHKFKAKKSSFTITWYMSWITEFIDHPTKTGVQFFGVDQMSRRSHAHGSNIDGGKVKQVKKATSSSMTATFDGEKTISTRDFKNLNLINAIYDPDAPAGSSNVFSGGRHNNIPPFITEYVWKRDR